MLIYKYQIPDPSRPAKTKTPMAPSGRLTPFKSSPVEPGQVVGREIVAWTPYAGTYGMGGPGFVGFKFENEWLIVAIWGAADWMRFDGRLLADTHHHKHARPPGWTSEPSDVWKELFRGRRFVGFVVERSSLRASLDDGRLLAISEDPADRPTFEGSGKPREIGPDDDMRRVVFLSPTAEIWV